MKQFHQITLNQTTIQYQNLSSTLSVSECLHNYVSPSESLMIQNKILKPLEKNLIIFHNIYTHPDFRQQSSATHCIQYAEKTLIDISKIFILFCDNYYKDFNLCNWYEKLLFKESYYNSETTMFLKHLK